MILVATHDTTKGTPQPGRPLPVDDHGRRLSTTPDAAAHYRAAQRAVPAVSSVRGWLRKATDADSEFVVADAALAALAALERNHADEHDHGAHEERSVHDEAGAHGGPRARGRPSTSWERRHVEVVAASRSTRPERAVDLLREHLLDVGCDPIACLVVSTIVDTAEIDDLLANGPRCHGWRARD